MYYTTTSSLLEAQRINQNLQLQNYYLKDALANAVHRDSLYYEDKYSKKLDDVEYRNAWLKLQIDLKNKKIAKLQNERFITASKVYKDLLKTRWRLKEAKNLLPKQEGENLTYKEYLDLISFINSKIRTGS